MDSCLDSGHKKLIKVERTEFHFQLECRLQEIVILTLTTRISQIRYKITIVLKPSGSQRYKGKMNKILKSNVPSWQEETINAFVTAEGTEKEEYAMHGGKEKSIKLLTN